MTTNELTRAAMAAHAALEATPEYKARERAGARCDKLRERYQRRMEQLDAIERKIAELTEQRAALRDECQTIYEHDMPAAGGMALAAYEAYRATPAYAAWKSLNEAAARDTQAREAA